MSKFILAAVAALSLATSAVAAPITYTAVLGDTENPPTGSPGTGTATVIIDTAAQTLAVSADFAGLTGTTTAAHIHCCVAVPGGNAGVATQTPSFFGFPLGVTSGTMDTTFDTSAASSWNAAFITANGGTPLGAEARLAAGLAAGQAYFNIHTSAFGGGEIRGFLVPAPVPEPASLALLGLGLVGAAMRRRRR